MNCRLVTPYLPKELIRVIAHAYGSNRTHHLPFAYQEKKEINNPNKRINKIVISGRLGEMYTLRNFAVRKRSTHWGWRQLTEILPHPGYRDIGEKLSHHIIGEDYIAYLSRFQMMFLCPSIYKAELLKYSECAYAGCCPVGEIPDGFPVEAASAILPLTVHSWREDVKRIKNTSKFELQQRAETYRTNLKKFRDATFLLKQLPE